MNSKIVIKYFGSIRDNLGISEEYLEIRDGWNVADAIDILNQKHKELVPRSRDFLIALNREYTDKSATLRNGDEIAIFNEDGDIITSAEDIGRHNAVDKVIGNMLWNNLVPAQNFIMQVSGRAGFEIVQKAAIAGIPIISSVSAPSSLSIEAADALGITLVCFVRENGFNVYTHQERVILE